MRDDSIEGKFAPIGRGVGGSREHAAVVVQSRHIIREVISLQDGNDFFSSPCGPYLKK